MSTTRTYQLLSDLPGTPIRTCEQILANKMQCWKPGLYLCTETTPEPTELVPDAVKTTKYQLCRNHAVIQVRVDQQAAAAPVEVAAEAAAAVPELPDMQPRETQASLLKQEQQATQTTMPQGENSPNNK